MYALKEKIHVFDLDGTLVDSMPIAVKIVLDFLTENGVSYSDEIIKILIPLGFKGIAKYYVSHFDIKMTAEEVFACFLEKLKDAYAYEIPLKAHVLETLQVLKKQGIRLNVLTASPHIFTDPCLQNRGIYKFFDNVWSSEEFGFLKSQKEIYGAVANALGVGIEDIVLIDDSLEVIKAAASARISTVGVYDDAWKKGWNEIQKTAKYTIADFSDLLKIVE